MLSDVLPGVPGLLHSFYRKYLPNIHAEITIFKKKIYIYIYTHIYIYLFIYLAAPGHVGFSSLTRNGPGPLHWECGVLATGPTKEVQK